MQQALRSEIPAEIALPSGPVPLRITRSSRARRYLLRLKTDGSVALTIPRNGTLAEGRSFLARNLGWLQRASERLARRPRMPKEWRLGTEIFWRGEKVVVETSASLGAGWIQFGAEVMAVSDSAGDLRPQLEKYMWMVAARELPPQVFRLASEHQVAVSRVAVRNQRSRWGSCSSRGVVSLNWRVLQAPPFVRDYLILHELMHLREMNHSNRFWEHVASVCPNYHEAERWLTAHSFLLR